MAIRLPLLWFSALILFVALVIQLARWKRAAETEKGLARVATVHIGTEHQTWLEQVSDAEEKQRRLEGQLLWRAPERLLPELGKISDRLSLSLLGVEELPEWRHGDYGSLPLQLTFSGNYSGFPAFLSVVERIVPAVRIEEVRLYRRKRGEDALWMGLTLAPMHKTVESDERRVESEKQKLTTRQLPPVTIKMPAIEVFRQARSICVCSPCTAIERRTPPSQRDALAATDGYPVERCEPDCHFRGTTGGCGRGRR